jgi:N-methylhydantoinase B
VLTARGMERFSFQPWGREGGQPGATGAATLLTPDGGSVTLGKIDLLRPPPRATLAVQTAGGGGYGDPFTRPAEAVLADVLDGLVSVEQARQAYGVVIRDGAVDELATVDLRAGARPAVSRFAFGVYRQTHEQRWPPDLQAALNRVTDGLAAAPRQYVRGRLVQAVEARDGQVDPAQLERLHAQVLAELELPLLQTL